MKNILNKIGKVSSFASRYIGIIIIAFSCLAFFWRDGFAWMTNYTSVFLGVIMFGMGLTIRMNDFKVVFSRPKEVIIGAVAQYTIMPLAAWVLCKVMHLPADLALGVILVGCCPGGTASNVITYIAGGDVALSVGMTIVSTLAAPLMTPFLVYVLAGAWVEVSFWAMVLSVIKVILVPVLLGILLRSLAGEHVDKVSDVMPLISVIAIVMIIGGIVAVNAEKILSCGVLVLVVVAIHNFFGMMLGLLVAKIFHIPGQLRLQSKWECRTVDLQCHLLLQILQEIHWQHFREQFSAYGIIFPVRFLQVSDVRVQREERKH